MGFTGFPGVPGFEGAVGPVGGHGRLGHEGAQGLEGRGGSEGRMGGTGPMGAPGQQVAVAVFISCLSVLIPSLPPSLPPPPLSLYLSLCRSPLLSLSLALHITLSCPCSLALSPVQSLSLSLPLPLALFFFFSPSASLPTFSSSLFSWSRPFSFAIAHALPPSFCFCLNLCPFFESLISVSQKHTLPCFVCFWLSLSLARCLSHSRTLSSVASTSFYPPNYFIIHYICHHTHSPDLNRSCFCWPAKTRSMSIYFYLYFL